VFQPDWGTKRLCESCGARFYDMKRSPIACPKCGVEHVPEAPPAAKAVRTRRRPFVTTG